MAEEGAPATGHRDRLLLAGLLIVVLLPLLVALGVLREPRWYPQGDMAQTELRVRDVGTAHPPLTGLAGRIGPFGAEGGSHPGPLSFWSLAPVYRLLGGSSWALLASTVVLQALSLGLTLWLARRRGGTPLMVGMAATLLVLVGCFGPTVLALPWNPYLPVLWWVTAVVAVWSLTEGDLPALPVAVGALSLCVQTHISYLGLGGALAVVGGGAAVAWTIARRRDREERRRALLWLAASAALGLALWFPPLAEQVTGSQGRNLSIIYRHFSDPGEAPVGLASGLGFVLSVLHPGTLLTGHAIGGDPLLNGATGPGIAVLAAWAATVGLAVWLGHRTLLRLHGLLAFLLVVGVVSAGRIFGLPFEYLALWGWSLGALLLLAGGWTLAAAGARLAERRTRDDGTRPWSGRRGVAALGIAGTLLVGGLAVRATVNGAHATTRQADHGPSLAVLSTQTGGALAAGDLPGTGRDGRYLFTWSDPWYQVGRAFSLFDELDRQGFDMGADVAFQQSLTRHRVRTAAEATARVHLVAGGEIAAWERMPGAHRVASYDPATPAERAEFTRLEQQVLAEMVTAGFADPPTSLARNPYALREPLFGDENVRSGATLSDEGRAKVGRLIEIGPPVAVFVVPPDAGPG